MFPASGFSCLSSCFWGLSSCKFQGHPSGWFQWFLLALQPASGKAPRHPAGGIPTSLAGALMGNFPVHFPAEAFQEVPLASSGSVVHNLAHGLLLVRPSRDTSVNCSTIQWATPIYPLHESLNLSPGGGGTVGNSSKYFVFAFGIK